MKSCKSNQEALGITDDDIVTAMKKIPGYLDITPGDFMEVYQVAYRHAFERMTSSIKAEDVMTKKVITIDENASLLDTAELMASHNISGIPVMNYENRLSGIISEKDFLKRMNVLKQPSVMHVICQWLGDKGSPVLDLKCRSAKEIMSQPPISVDLSATLLEVAKTLKTHKINRVPVLDKESNLAGIIARSDMVHAFCQHIKDGELLDEIYI